MKCQESSEIPGTVVKCLDYSSPLENRPKTHGGKTIGMFVEVFMAFCSLL